MTVKIITSALFATLCSFGTAQAAVHNIVDYGAVSDTTRLSTLAIQKAIDACSEAGGGTVFVPSGSYKTGSIMLKSNVTLNLENGATLYGSTDIKDYTPVTTDYVSLRTVTPTIQLIYADKADNVAITGEGTMGQRIFPVDEGNVKSIKWPV